MVTCLTSLGKGRARSAVAFASPFCSVTPRRLPVASTRKGDCAKKRREFSAFSQSCTSSKTMTDFSGTIVLPV